MKQADNAFFEDLNNIQVVCVYGQVNSSFFSFLKEWIEKNDDRKIIFLEDDFNKYEKSKKNLKRLNSKNISHIFLQDNLENSLKEIAWNCIYLNLKIIKSSSEKRTNKFLEISQILTDLHLGANVTSYVYADFGIKIFENVYNNLIHSESFIFFDTLCNKFKNIPAIIAGAGPSLDSNIDLLKNAYDKALIFAGGSALNIFSKNKIRHHFSGFIDPDHNFNRFMSNHNFENLFFYTNQMSHHNLSIIQANKILVSDYGAYPLKNWMYDELNIKQDVFEAGWNVSTFLIKIAALLGCNPIYFVGLDLSFKKDKYAKGIINSEKMKDSIRFKNIDNETVYSQKDWILAKNWIEEFVLENKEIDFVNATEGGIKINNVKNFKLKDILDNMNTTQDLFGLANSIYQNQKRIKLQRKKVIDVIQIIKKSFERSNLLCDEYLLEIEKENIDLNLIKFQKEIVYINHLDPLWQIWKFVILPKVEKNAIHILINKLLFFKNVISNHLKMLGDILC